MPTPPDPASPCPAEEGWRRRAACHGLHPSTFVTDIGRGHADALAVCEMCPVRSPCLAHALADPELVGVWGGTTTNDRKRLRRAAG